MYPALFIISTFRSLYTHLSYTYIHTHIGYAVVHGNMSIGNWIAVQSWVTSVFAPLNYLGMVRATCILYMYALSVCDAYMGELYVACLKDIIYISYTNTLLLLYTSYKSYTYTPDLTLT